MLFGSFEPGSLVFVNRKSFNCHFSHLQTSNMWDESCNDVQCEQKLHALKNLCAMKTCLHLKASSPTPKKL